MNFRTVSAALSKSASTKTTNTSLRFKVELEGSFDRIELETGEVLRDPQSYTSSAIKEENPEVSLGIYRESLGRAKVDEGADRIGTMHYHRAHESAFADGWPSSISIQFYLDDTEYDRLLDAVSRGVLPKNFVVSTPTGIHLGGAEGELTKWNTKEMEVLPIEQVSGVFEMNAPSPAVPVQETQHEKQLLSTVTKIGALLTLLLWCFVGAAVVYLALQWKK
jgi:hypothetical protein